jgi:hypothetical protein
MKTNEQTTGKLAALILKTIATAPVHSLADLRKQMPEGSRGLAFDNAVLQLADEQRVVVSQDANPLKFSVEERAQYVQDGRCLLTTISKRN